MPPEKVIPFSSVISKCYIAYGDGLDIPVREWTTLGPHRFYFTQAYDAKSQSYVEVPPHAAKIGIPKKGKGISHLNRSHFKIYIILCRI